jgi:hypothetical protein
MTAQIITFPHVLAGQIDQALDYYMQAETPVGVAIRTELVGMIMAKRRGLVPPPMPMTERAVRLWPLISTGA